jgi:hypothetical protein
VQLVWQQSPYATGYVVQRLLPDGSVGDSKEVADPDQAGLEWTELAPGEQCFRVVVVGQGGRSEPSERKCTDVPTPAPTTSPTPSGPPTSAPPTTGTSPSPPLGVDPVQGAYYVVYVPPTPVDDTPSQGRPDEIVADLQQAGVQALPFDSRQSERLPDGPAGLWVILQDGFATFAEARAECDAHLDVAPECTVRR